MMAKRKTSDYGTGIPRHEMELFARVLLPDIQAFFESEEGKHEFAAWQEKITQKKGEIKMGKINNEFQASNIKDEKTLFDLAAASEKVCPSYDMGTCGFDRFILYSTDNDQTILLQVERYADGHHHISIQGGYVGYVMFNDSRFLELLEKF